MKTFVRGFFSRPTAVFGFVVFAAIAIIALLAPLLFAGGPFTIVGMPLRPPGAPGVILGSDILGRDMAVGWPMARASRCWWVLPRPLARWASACCWVRSPAIMAARLTTF